MAMAASNLKMVLDKKKLVHQGGNLWVYELPLSAEEGDSNDFPYFSRWELYENDKKLGPPHSLHSNISTSGKGCYSHWHNYLYMSSSDNESPCSSGKSYRFVNNNKSIISCKYRKLLSKFFLKRHSLFLLAISLLVVFCVRMWLIMRALPCFFTGKHKIDRENFKTFYTSYVEMYDLEKNGCLFSQIFFKYLERRYYQRIVQHIRPPSLEIGVYNGATSVLALNYPFTTGTELFIETCLKYRERMPHKELKYYDLTQYDNIAAASYNTVVMVHSVDDFTDADTRIVFRAFSHLLAPEGKVYFSGYSDHMQKTYFPYTLFKRIYPDATFYDFRKMHEGNLLNNGRTSRLCAETGLRLVKYEEFNKDPLFIFIDCIEDYVSKLFYASTIRQLIWKNRVLKKIHISLNSYLASYLTSRERRYETDSRARGINFFCVAGKQVF